METTELVIDSKLQSNLNLLIENTLEEEIKWKKTWIPSLIITPFNQKKRKYQTKKIKPHNTTITKSRNFLTNISYNGVKEKDLWDRSFVFDVYVLATKNINPFSLEQKIFGIKNREMINMFWGDCSKPSFYKHICKSDNFLYLKGKNVVYPQVADIFLEIFGAS